ncbi:KRAB-A domain-containing protein 2-like [Oratosquilla oratoria]|uniref:KRAB-A domain-containing protein 2-like n=1 Tax=Oratosquilla oratoria TaxID=337810 RepID=UPI003F75AD59
MIDCATRYPEAIPLRRITAKNVVRDLVHFFTQVGLPTIVQSDQGPNFTSRLFNQVMQSLGVRQSRSSVYHPQSQGVVERFHQTFKRMLRTYCLEFGKDWDEGVDLLLFTVRDSVQESLGISPFQLIYGHK